jgi:S-methylmethionine-dependent homocysteine/selenocysteine methylase
MARTRPREPSCTETSVVVTFTLLDGGMGRELERLGAPFRQPEWSALALMDGPEWVVQAHQNFIDAGADVITTNSYAVVPFHIGEDRFATDGMRLAELSGRLAREVASSASVRVAGSLPPLFGSYEPSRFVVSDAMRIARPLVDGLAPWVDHWLAETLGSIGEVLAARAAIDAGAPDDKPLWVSYALTNDGAATLLSGEPIADGVRAALDAGAEAVLFNCSAVESISTALHIAAEIVPTGVRIGGYANRFVANHAETGSANEQISSFRTDLDPSSYCSFVRTWIGLGASVVGGCCGMTPEHIAAIGHLRG